MSPHTSDASRPSPPLGCRRRYLLNPLLPVGAPALKRRGTGYGNDALKAKQAIDKTRRAALKPPPGTIAPKKNPSGRRLTEREAAATRGGTQ